MISRIDIEDMTDAQDEAPERIWASSNRRRQWAGCGGWRVGRNPDDQAAGFPDAEYVRSDLARPSQAEDERVEALVSFARPFADALDIECDFMTPPAPFEDGFDVRRRARAALAAMDTPKGGGDE